MRLGVFIVAACLVGSVVSFDSDVSCNECDSACQQTCTDSCSWLQSNTYSCGIDDYWGGAQVSCTCYISGWVWALLATAVFSLLMACLCVPPIAIIVHYWNTDDKTPISPPAPGKYRLFTARNPFLYRNAVTCLNIISCTVCRPFLVLESVRMGLRRVDVRGTRLSLNADWSDYCKLVWLPTCCFNALTCGFYTWCGFAEKREDEFLDEKTSVLGQPGQPVVFFRAKASWWYRWLAMLVTVWTCGLAYSFFYVDLVSKSLERMDLAGVTASSIMQVGNFFASVWLRTCICNCFTCYLYSFCGYASGHEKRYADDHLRPVATVHAKSPLGDCNLNYGSTSPSYYTQGPELPPPTGRYNAPMTTPAMNDNSFM